MSAKLTEQLGWRSGRVPTPDGRVVNCITETDELRRIRDMPLRVWQKMPDLDRYVDLMTEAMRTPLGTQRLRYLQAVTFEELVRLRGSFVTGRVGAGKTLTGGLAGLALQLAGLEELGKGPILYLTRASVLDGTRADLYAAAEHWRVQPVTMKTYSKLAIDYDDEILGGLQPKVIIADECDALKNSSTGAWHVLQSYIVRVRATEAFHGEKLIFLPMCGTPTDTSMAQYWHIARAALGDNAPLPRSVEEKAAWCAALDEKVQENSRWQPGALVRLHPDVDPHLPPIRAGRVAFGLRFTQTPGVVTTGDDRPNNRLEIKALPLVPPPVVADAIKQMRETWTTPDGLPFDTAMDLWRHARELQCGFYLRPEPPPPQEWLDIRKDWWVARDDVRARYKLQTPGHVVIKIKRGDFDEKEPELVDAWLRWDAMRTGTPDKPAYKRVTVAEWISDYMVELCAEWLEKEKGLLWVEFPDLGRRLSKLTGVPFFHAKARDDKGNHILQHKGGRPAIAAVKSCSYGLNLQFHGWTQNFYATPMSTSNAWEQSLGRTHRDGQPAPTVYAVTYMACDESYQSMLYAIRRAEMASDTLQQGQKLCYAEVRDFSAVEEFARRDEGLWHGVAGASASDVLSGGVQVDDEEIDDEST